MGYHYSRYNHHGVLRVNWMLWLTLLYMTRHTLVLAFLLFAASRGQTQLGLSALFQPIYMISDIPALALLLAMGARVPQAGRVARAVWRHGRQIILDSIALYFVLFLWKHWPDIGRLDPLVWGNILVNLVIAGLVMRSRYLADLFNDFPQTDNGADNGND